MPSAGLVAVGTRPISPSHLPATPATTPGTLAPSLGTPERPSAANYVAFKPIAECLAARIAPDLIPFAPSQALTTKARWFRDGSDQLLVVVVGAHEAIDVADDVLAYALAWQRDRDLVLVLPENRVGLTLQRLPWIETPVRVFTYSDDLKPRPAVIPARAEVIAEARQRPLRSTAIHDLGRRDRLVEQLRRRLDGHWALVPAHRSSYLAWHCLGRQVVRIARTTGGVTILAGVAYGKPVDGQSAALSVPLLAALSPVQLAAVEHRVAGAVSDRLSGLDRNHVEHRMQAALASTGLTDLNIDSSHLAREYPAWRGDRRPGFIDFLALDRNNVLHVIETKVGTADVKGVLQTLDYATWVTAHAAEIRTERGWAHASGQGPETVMLDFILAPKAAGSGPAVGPYLAGQLEALSSVPWRVAIVADPLAEVPKLDPSSRRVVPSGPLVAPPVQAPRWVATVGSAIAGGAMSPAPLHATPEIALLPEARTVFADLVSRGLDHRWALHHRSSQAFALNLFAPLDHVQLCAVLAQVGLEATSVESIAFEYSDPEDRLGEMRAKSAHRTQVDVVVRGTSSVGERIVALVEVKFTETDFGYCSAYENPANPRRDVCRSVAMFGGHPEDCFQLANHGVGRRKYHDLLASIPVVQPSGAGDPGGCLVRTSLSQPMRSLALAHLLLGADEADRVAYVLCSPANHPTIWRRFAELRAAFPDTEERTIRFLTAEQVASHHTDRGAGIAALYPSKELEWATPSTDSQGVSRTMNDSECHSWVRGRAAEAGLATGATS